MEYMLMFRETSEDFARRDDPEVAPAYWGAWNAYIGALTGAGMVVGDNGLQPPRTSTTVRLRGGKRQVQDGPFADSHEHLGGHFVIDVPSLGPPGLPVSRPGGGRRRPRAVRRCDRHLRAAGHLTGRRAPTCCG